MPDAGELFKHSNSGWVRYSDYEYRPSPDGALYLTPAKGAKLSMHNPLQSSESLIVDALNIGRLCVSANPEADLKTQILTFAKQYGLMGFMTAYLLKTDFSGSAEVLLHENPITDSNIMKTEDYLKYFMPFDKDIQALSSSQNTTGYIRKNTMPITSLMHRTPEYSLVFSKNYAERYEWIVKAFRQWYIHLGACFYYNQTDDNTIRDLYVKTVQGFCVQGASYRINLMNEPVITWEFPSLKTAIDVVYSFYVADKQRPLRICKHCGKIFITTNTRAEFCSVPCRIRYNVYKSRRNKDR